MAKSIQGLAKKIEGLKRDLDTKPKRNIRREARTTTAMMKRRVIEQDAVAETELFRGIGATNTPRGVNIVSSAPYSGYVEFGTGPKHILNPYTGKYKKPEFSGSLVAALTRWAAVKPSLLTDDPVAVGWAVARVISGEAKDSLGGTEAQPFFTPVWESQRPVFIDQAEMGVEQALNGM